MQPPMTLTDGTGSYYYTVSPYLVIDLPDSAMPGWCVFDIVSMLPVVYGIPDRVDALREYLSLTISGRLTA